MNLCPSEDSTLSTRRPIAVLPLAVAMMTALAGCASWQPPWTVYHPSSYGTAGTAPSAATEFRHLPDQQTPAGARPEARSETVVRGQDAPAPLPFGQQAAGSGDYLRGQMPVSQAQALMPPPPGGQTSPYAPSPYNLPPPTETQPLIIPNPQGTYAQPYAQPYIDIDPTMSTPVDVYVEETQTGRFMFGAGINSDAGVTGQIVIDERNFDITRFPTSWRDFADGTAFRGGGQGFRLEAMPGTQVQRYLASFTEPYFLNTPVSLNLSGFLYDRRFYDWDEARLGGRVALGYRLTPDLSISGALRAERVEIDDPRVLIPDLAEVLGDNNLYSGRLSLTHDTRDIPFSPTEGHLFELSYEQVFGSFDYSRVELDFRKYFLIRERPDGSGRHTLGFMHRLGFTGSQTPIFERFYAGGFSTMRGFDYRGASPELSTVRVGGDFMFLGSAEYMFPLTADDMLKGALFVDYGTVEREIEIKGENFRVAPGFGVRISVPALGPAPLAFDFAFPIAKADTDDTRVFTFFFGMGR